MTTKTLAFGVVLVLAGYRTASAHVTIQPKEAAAKASQEYTVRVPTEKDTPTISVRMVFPQGFDVSRFRRTSGWNYELERDANGRITAITWSGGKVGREEYEQFYFMGRATEPGTYKLDTFQTYEPNDVVGWVNPAEPRPAPQVTIVAAANSASGGTTGAAPTSPAGDSQPSRRGLALNLQTVVSAASLLTAAVFAAGWRRALRRSRA